MGRACQMPPPLQTCRCINYGAVFVQAAREMVALHRGETAPARVSAPRTTARSGGATRPPTFDATRIRALRGRLGLSQAVFAQLLNVSGKTVQAWEIGGNPPSGAAARLLELTEERPEVLLGKLNAGV